MLRSSASRWVICRTFLNSDVARRHMRSRGRSALQHELGFAKGLLIGGAIVLLVWLALA